MLSNPLPHITAPLLGLLLFQGAKILIPPSVAPAQAPPAVLPQTAPLTMQGDIASELVAGVDRFLLRELDASLEKRKRTWPRPEAGSSDLASWKKAIEPLREKLRYRIGLADQPIADPELILQSPLQDSQQKALSSTARMHWVRWPIYPGVDAEGLLWLPTNAPTFLVVLVPDASQSPQELVADFPDQPSTARQCVQSGGAVLIPSVLQRDREARRGRAKMTDQEFIYRSAFELGRHPLGYHVRESISGIQALRKIAPNCPTMIAGWGEGGWIALHAAAVSDAFDSVCISGHFKDRRTIWEEPIHRNIHGLLESFGDAQLAAMIAPRIAVIDAQAGPQVEIPGEGGAPGKLSGPSAEQSKEEWQVAQELLAPWQLENSLRFHHDGKPSSQVRWPAIQLILSDWKIDQSQPIGPVAQDHLPGPSKTQQRQNSLEKWDRFRQQRLELVHEERARYWSTLDTSSLEGFEKSVERFRTDYRESIIGDWKQQALPLAPESRLQFDKETWTGYEILLPVYPDVFAYGSLLLPKGIQPGERRPVVVFQHGLEGRPVDVIEGDHEAYHDVAARLAQRGFIVFAPQNLYLFHDRFRTLQRKSNPLGKTLFSTIVPQHQQIVDWLKTLPSVDPKRIAFYGLSYGGKSAMRIPPLVPDYCLSICSADFNDWVWKNASSSSSYSYVWTMEYEIFEFDLGRTFNYAEMAALIAPRPFMVERGHFDGVAPDERVALEYAKVQHLYEAKLKLADQTEIEWFVGPHTINGKGTFDFLHRHLNWPQPK
ncbi:MAG: dienelactone hydrolase family protein [Pirellulaceae bacterium]